MKARILLALLAVATPNYALADDNAASVSHSAELDRIKSEQRAQRAILSGMIKLMQQRLTAEQAALDALQAAVLSTGAANASLTLPLEDKSANSAARDPANGTTSLDPIAAGAPTSATSNNETKPAAEAATGIVEGSVTVTGGGQAWVYLAEGPGPRGGKGTMKQLGKAFVPGILVVAKGAKVEFPNGDPVFHNVFSDTPGAQFDLGSYPQGDKRTLTLTQTGQIDVQCNLHANMRGYVFVTPNALFTKIAADGSFVLKGVPSGKRRIGVWAPNAKPVVREVRVRGGESTRVALTVKPGQAKPHVRKDGTPFGSYDE